MTTDEERHGLTFQQQWKAPSQTMMKSTGWCKQKCFSLRQFGFDCPAMVINCAGAIRLFVDRHSQLAAIWWPLSKGSRSSSVLHIQLQVFFFIATARAASIVCRAQLHSTAHHIIAALFFFSPFSSVQCTRLFAFLYVYQQMYTVFRCVVLFVPCFVSSAEHH